MPEEIAPLPIIPDSLRTAATHGSLVPFVGAGLSKLGGCPDWKDFANRSLDFFVNSGKIDYLYLDQISTLSPRVKLSLARSLAVEHGLPIDYSGLLRPNSEKAIARGHRAYEALAKLAKVFVTTNYDEWLDTIQSEQQSSTTFGSINCSLIKVTKFLPLGIPYPSREEQNISPSGTPRPSSIRFTISRASDLSFTAWLIKTDLLKGFSPCPDDWVIT